VKSMAWCLCCKLICYLFVIYGNGDGGGDSCMRGWMGTGRILKLLAGIGGGDGVRVPGTAGMRINICPRAALYSKTAKNGSHASFYTLIFGNPLPVFLSRFFCCTCPQGRQSTRRGGTRPPKFVLGDTSCIVPPKVE